MANETTITSDNLKLIQETAVEAAGAKNLIVPLPEEPPGVYGVLTDAGNIAKICADRGPRRGDLLSISEIDGALAHYREIYGENAKPVVWYSPDVVTVVLDDDAAKPWRDCLRVNLAEMLTDQWHIVLNLHNEEWGQREFLDLLRRDLWDCLASDLAGSLTKQVAALDWSVGSNTTGTIERSRASYGRDVEAQVVSKHGEMPDDLTLSVRIFDDPELAQRRRVRCALEANPARQVFKLIPYAGERERAMEQEMAFLSGMLSAELSCPVILGRVAGD